MDAVYLEIKMTPDEYRLLSRAASKTGEQVRELAKIGALAQAEMVLELEAEHDREQGNEH